jgi:hypothetical protein
MCYLALAEEYGLDNGDKALNQISTHEQVCEQRYLRIEERLNDGSRRFDKQDRMLYGIIILIIGSILIPQFLGG